MDATLFLPISGMDTGAQNVPVQDENYILKTSKLFITALFRWNLSTSAVITNKDRQI
jgi:hypothetical protein